MKGWQCPICKSVMAPWVPICYFCRKDTNTNDNHIKNKELIKENILKEKLNKI